MKFPPNMRSDQKRAGARRAAGLIVLGVVTVLILQSPAWAQWWRRGSDKSGTRYGVRFLALESDKPVQAPLTTLRVGERHRIRVALYAIRDGQLDTSQTLDRGPRGTVAVRCESSNTKIIAVEPDESQITAGYETAYAEFWISGVKPGQARITAQAGLGGGAVATTWFGPVRVEAAVVAQPKRLRPPKRAAPAPPEEDASPEVAPAPQPAVASSAAQGTRTADNNETPAPSVTTNPMAVAAGVSVNTALPSTLQDSVNAALPSALQGPGENLPAPVGLTPVGTVHYTGPAPPPAEPAAPVGPPAPVLAPKAPEQLPPASADAPQHLFREPAPGPPEPPPMPAAGPAEPAPVPCPRFTALTIQNVGPTPVDVQVRDSGAAAPRMERLDSGAVLAMGLERGAAVWIEAHRASGDRQGVRLRAAQADASAQFVLPQFATEPWLTIKPTLADCGDDP